MGDSEAPANRQMPIASVVRRSSKKEKRHFELLEKSLKNCPLHDFNITNL
jgi:hypothetical protein